MLSFDEFRAANERERSKQKFQDISEAAKTKKSNKTVKAVADNANVVEKEPDQKADSKTSSSSSTLGDFLEMHQLQAFLVVLLILDTFGSFGEVYLGDTIILTADMSPESTQRALYYNYTLELLKAFTGFTLIFFGIEILAVLLVFRFSALGHYGYLLDGVIVSTQLYLEMHGSGKETRILNIFRFWRLFRLFNALVNLEKEKHQTTKTVLEEKIARIQALVLEKGRLEDEVSKEKEARDAVEKMMQGYKEEVDTLNEALRIAAMDIAEVAEAEDDYDDDEGEEEEEEIEEKDDEDGAGKDPRADAASTANEAKLPKNNNRLRNVVDGDDEEGDFVDAVGGLSEKYRKKEILFHEARQQAAGKRGNKLGGPVTIVVNEDGSYHSH